MSVHKKLMQARVKILDTKLEKTGHNKFAGYKYFELGDFLPPAQRIFNDLGLCGVISYTELNIRCSGKYLTKELRQIIKEIRYYL